MTEILSTNKNKTTRKTKLEKEILSLGYYLKREEFVGGISEFTLMSSNEENEKPSPVQNGNENFVLQVYNECPAKLVHKYFLWVIRNL